ncbi:dTMP kinase [Buchnera aphidicola (Chaitoregma tattakana)]|uniref:dTMP kinase n=1 Tax=Buchnera aphidicola TaxID=9 RepID=UPI0031B8591B
MKKNKYNNSLYTKNNFIVLEGIEGSGKTEIIRYLKLILKNQGIKKIMSVRQPGGTPICEKLRSILKKDIINDQIHSKTEILLFYASRMQLLESKILPALNKDTWVISDRHNLSTLAYQTAFNKNNKNLIKKLTKILLKNIEPDLTIYLDTIPILGLNRINERNKIDRIEKKGLSFFKEVRKNYLKEIKKISKKIIINSSLEKKIVMKSLKKKIILWLQKYAK